MKCYKRCNTKSYWGFEQTLYFLRVWRARLLKHILSIRIYLALPKLKLYFNYKALHPPHLLILLWLASSYKILDVHVELNCSTLYNNKTPICLASEGLLPPYLCFRDPLLCLLDLPEHVSHFLTNFSSWLSKV